MSQITAHSHGDHHGSGHGHDHHEPPHVAARAKLDLSAVILPAGYGRILSAGLMLLGVGALAFLLISAMAAGTKEAKTHALGSYHIGFLYVLGLSLGCLGMQMIFQQFNAGWSAAVRRQAENIASLMWVPLLMFIPIAILEVFVFKGVLFKWMNDEYVRGDVLYDIKKPWLNESFWLIRAFVYFGIWIGLGTALYKLSRKQDETGDRWLTAKSRWISSWGLLLFALSSAFASFDWLMGLDFHWFSTMFGVYFFAGSICSTAALIAVILCTLRINGKLGNAFTQEHQHDLGKLVFAFTCFWAYITFCQYFLIWYSNIPEETAFFNLRNDGGYQIFFKILIFGHFIIPFVFLLIRPFKRNPHTLRLAALWMLVMHGIDMYYMVRPMIKDVKIGQNVLVDVLGILGPVLLFLGLVVWKISKAPLVPIKDPRLHEVLEHKNYV